jgi:hypothetical protein
LTPLVAIAIITGISALLYLYLQTIAKFSDKLAAITQLDPKRGRQISIMIFMASFGALQLTYIRNLVRALAARRRPE